MRAGYNLRQSTSREETNRTRAAANLPTQAYRAAPEES